MKKRLGLFMAILILILGVWTSCFGAKKKIVVGFSQVGAESAWRIANTESIISEAKKRGIDLKFADAQQRPENQIKALRNFIAQKVDVIGFAPLIENGFEPVLREAKKAKIPVIIIDRRVDVKDTSLWVTHMGSDFVEEGRRAARFLIERGYKGNIVELQGTVNSAPALGRKKGFAGVIKSHPEFKLIRSETADFSRSKGREVMAAFLKAYGKKINILFAHNDDMAIGAIQAIEEFGLIPGKEIIIVSIDGIRGAFEAMIEGKLNCTVECNPLLGPQFFDAVEAIMAGKAHTLPKEIITKESVFPMEVAKDVLPTRKY
ncbi:MAG: ABC transporter substrate-binding protein [Firmicutes bacterium]|nr:ABC transporter substrate-binding protein [Bacillota bacterium]